jgi:hypothetical protein
MAIDFPNSPTLDDVFTVGTRSWKWTGSVWESVTTTSETAPATEYTAGANISLAGDEIAVVASPNFSTVRLTATTEANLTSTAHAFQIGASSGVNLVADGNEIMARNNSGASQLNLNPDGGNVSIGNATSVVTSVGPLTTNQGITNPQQKNALVASGYDSASGLFAQTSRVVMTATSATSDNPTTRPDGTALQVGDVWIDFQ